jgi:hypothetical protein
MDALLDLFCALWFLDFFLNPLGSLCQHVSHFSKKNIYPGPPLHSHLLGLLWARWALNKFGPVKTHSWVIFPFEYVKVEDFPKNLLRSRTLLKGGSLMSVSWTINVCYLDLYSSPWLLDTWILFLNPPLKFKLDKVEGRCWWMGPLYQNLWTRIMCYLDFILFHVNAGYMAFIFEPSHEIRTWYGWRTLLTGCQPSIQ